MKPSDYSAKRDELIAILDRIIAIDMLSPEKKREFREIQRKCREDQFNIVLIGEFQGGKSTTFNAFCDGREISPRGAMVKTSACRLTATNLSDSNKAEYATVYWKTSKDLLISMDDILTKHIDLGNDLNIHFKAGDQVLTLDEVLDFDNPDHLVLISKALLAEWEQYEQSRSSYTPERLDILRIATLIVKFVNAPELKTFQARSGFSITDITRLMIFPSNWEQKWQDGAEAGFTPGECMFAFIGGIDCYIHSPNLSRLGCSITDCPGLFASKWDTEVATDTIPRGDAILYLLRGDRTIGTEDIRALREIQKMPASLKKLFFAINLKISRAIIENSIIPEDVAKINSIGVEIAAADIKRYHALLAFLGQFGDAVLQDTMEISSQAIFTDMAKRMLGQELPLENSWTLLVNQQLLHTIIPPQMVEGLNDSSAKKVMDLSGFRDLFDGIEEFIINNKAYSILITNGSEKAAHALKGILTTLKNREEDATRDVEKRLDELRKADSLLNDFQRKAQSIVQDGFPDLVYDMLVNDFFDEVVDGTAEEISVKVAHRLGEKLNGWLAGELILKSVWSKSALDKKVAALSAPVYKEVMKETMLKRARIWLTEVARGENEKYKATIVHESKRMTDELAKGWKELSDLKINITELAYPDITQLVEQVVLQAPLKDGHTSTFYALASVQLITSIFKFIINAPKLLWNELVDILPDWLKPGKVEIDEDIVVNSNPQSFEELGYKAKQMYHDILLNIKSANSTPEIKKEIKKNILENLRRIGTDFKTECTTALDMQKKQFEADFAVTEESYKKSNEERMEVANSARKAREIHIEPRMAEIISFHESVSDLFK